ncbi:MAG: aldehyde ferredoxin oxidoreductase C-terminal domain-containing protein [Candidatus Bathyarchaeota archaeon]|nr:aldehyde ferredoxin oxidoreductase C-terminal domain-containing protein [Candidatus Bathyarchaeota archaeon]
MGVTRKDDTLPDRFLKELINEGPAKDQIVELGPILEEFNTKRGLGRYGRPNREKLFELGLKWVSVRV